MSVSRRHRWLARLQACLLATFALGLFWQSTLGSLGDLHEAIGHGGAETAHAVGVDAGHPHEGGSAGKDGIPHALLHFAHCCGHVVALPAVALGYGLLSPVASRVMPPASVALPAAHLSGPFRPPIQA